jgi:bifunctional non-homologous end joining protein LigD
VLITLYHIGRLLKFFIYGQARLIAVSICEEIHLLVPAITTTAVSISRRGNKLYIDPNQNDEADTVAAAYSVRPYHIPTVSTPIEWKEITNKLNSADFTIKTIQKRLRKKGDLWMDILNQKVITQNSKILSQFVNYRLSFPK